MLEQKNAECTRLQAEVRQAKEEAKSSLAQLQEAMQVRVRAHSRHAAPMPCLLGVCGQMM